MKKGLVLEGGAMRGLFTAGIIDVMMEAHVEPDGLIGVSAGAAFGCNYKSRQVGRAIRYNTRFATSAIAVGNRGSRAATCITQTSATTSYLLNTISSMIRHSKRTLWSSTPYVLMC